MPRFAPFAGIRYDPERFRPVDVTAPPYDVIDADDRASLVARSPRNAVVIDLPDEADGPNRYDAARATFEAWLADGVLVTDPQPSFTVYRMGYTDDLGRPVETTGVIGALTLSRPGEGAILPHEHTTAKARSDRLELTRATRANLSAVWGLSLTKGLTAVLDTATAPFASWTDDDGVDHTVWRVDDPERIRAIGAAVGATPVVVADGHHRYETALAYRDERRGVDGDATPAEAVMMFVVELVDDQLTVRPIHRLLSGLPVDFDLRGKLTARHFEEVGELGPQAVADGRVLRLMDEAGALALVHPSGGATMLRPNPEAFADVADLDSARIAVALADVPGVAVAYQHGIDQVARAVSSGRAQAAVLLRPATVAQIEANAHAGERMPPKTTFFHPKPKTGIVFRSLA